MLPAAVQKRASFNVTTQTQVIARNILHIAADL